jgi:mRNA interferase RelE/StbE
MDSNIARRIRTKVLDHAKDPKARNNNVEKLVGIEGYRLRIGDWRAIYTLRQQTLTVVVVRIGHRREVYE